MATKEIIYDQEGREQLRSGVQTLAKAVKVTLGPKGRNVVLSKDFGSPTVTKDGVTVAEEIDLDGRFRNMGAQMVKEAASRANEQSGDGTTTATVLAEAIFLEGMKSVVGGNDPIAIQRGIHKTVKSVSRFLQEKSSDVSKQEEIENIATIAANNDPDIGGKLSQAMEEVGEDGVITVEEGKSLETTVETVEGMQFDRGYLSPYFVTNQENREVVLEDPYILIHEEKISNLQSLIPVIEQVKDSGKPFLIIAENIEGEALATLVVNKLRGTFRSAAVKAPGYGDRREQMLKDIAVLTGGDVIWDDVGINLEDVTIDQLGRAKKVVIDQDETTIIEGAGSTEAIEKRAGQIQRQMDEADSDYDREKLEERLGKLAGGVAQVNVGGATEVEVEEKKARAEDALHATRAAVEEGILPGGGVSLLRATRNLEQRVKGLTEEERAGLRIVKQALRKPAMQIANNAGSEGGVVAERILEADEFEYGYNAREDEFTNLVEAGVVDPTKVVRQSLEYAASVSAMMLTTNALISGGEEEAGEEAGAAPGAGGMGGGMGGMGGGMPGGMGGGMGGMMGGMGGMGGGLPGM